MAMKSQVKSPFVTVASLENAIEAQLVESILTERRVPHRIRSYHDTAYDGLFQMQKGWGEIQAPSRFAGAIREVLSAVRAQAEKDSTSSIRESTH